MKKIISKTLSYLFTPAMLTLLFFSTHTGTIMAQADSTVTTATDEQQKEEIPKKYKDKKLVKTPFKSIWLVDNATTTVPVRNTLQMDIQHRFGTFLNGYKDFIGIYAAANIRIGVEYTAYDNLMVGFGFTKERLSWDFSARYAIVKQKQHGWPVNITYFGNMVVDTRSKTFFRNGSDRLSYFNQLIFSSRICEFFALQVAPSISWFNNVEGYVNDKGEIIRKMHNEHIALSMMGRIQVNKKMAITIGYDQPLTAHLTNNPHPNLSLGLDMTTSGHSFQVFIENYNGINAQSSNFYNQNDYKKGAFLIGFNITRLWNL